MRERTRNQSVTFEWDEVDSVTREVVEAVATVTGLDPTEFDPLATAIDPDALEALFAPRDGGERRDRGYVQFPVAGHDVTVYAHGEVVVHQ